jgi:hypothetical protein
MLDLVFGAFFYSITHFCSLRIEYNFSTKVATVNWPLTTE